MKTQRASLSELFRFEVFVRASSLFASLTTTTYRISFAVSVIAPTTMAKANLIVLGAIFFFLVIFGFIAVIAFFLLPGLATGCAAAGSVDGLCHYGSGLASHHPHFVDHASSASVFASAAGSASFAAAAVDIDDEESSGASIDIYSSLMLALGVALPTLVLAGLVVCGLFRRLRQRFGRRCADPCATAAEQQPAAASSSLVITEQPCAGAVPTQTNVTMDDAPIIAVVTATAGSDGAVAAAAAH